MWIPYFPSETLAYILVSGIEYLICPYYHHTPWIYVKLILRGTYLAYHPSSHPLGPPD